jgi:hypothetical protein
MTGDAIRLQRVNLLTYNVTDKERALRLWEDVLGVMDRRVWSPRAR